MPEKHVKVLTMLKILFHNSESIKLDLLKKYILYICLYMIAIYSLISLGHRNNTQYKCYSKFKHITKNAKLKYKIA